MPALAARERAEHIDLAISGMTCASCAVRVEKRLSKLDGVSASVNFASELASVRFDPARASVDDLIKAVGSAGYAASPPVTGAVVDDPVRPYRSRLVLAAALSVPVAIWMWVAATRFGGWEWASLVLTTVVVVDGGWPFHRATVLNARHGVATMDTLISLGTLAAWGWSAVVLVAGLDEAVYFDTATIITALALLGRYVEARAKRRSGDAMRALLEVGAKQAHVLKAGAEVVVAVEDLRVGDLFVVRPGEKVATDGVVTAGVSVVDQSVLTGEPVPVEVGPGREVAGGAVNSSGRLVVKATRVGSATALAQVARLVAEAQAGKAPVQRLVDQVTEVFVPVVIGLAVLTLGGWLVFSRQGTAAAFTAAVAVVVIACPCALGLATPTALMVGTGRGARLGIVMKGPEVLEQTKRVTTVVVDKTGTLTEGKMEVVAIVPAGGIDEQEVLRMAAAVEDGSEHPIARAIAVYGRKRLGPLPAVEGFHALAGLGVSGTVAGHAISVGRGSLPTRSVRAGSLPPGSLPPGSVSTGSVSTGSVSTGSVLASWPAPGPNPAETDVPMPEILARETARLEATGTTVVVVARDGVVAGLVAVADRLKATSRQAMAELRALGLTPLLITGDNEAAAHAVAAEVGIERVRANVLPDGKAAEVRRLQQAGEVVAMIGDGVNDAPALAQADLGLSIGTGTDVAIEASDLTLVSGDVRAAGDAILLARRTLATIKGNLWWALAYNVAAIPLAMSGIVNPIIAAGAMAFSSTFVVCNSLRLRRFRPMREAP